MTPYAMSVYLRGRGAPDHEEVAIISSSRSSTPADNGREIAPGLTVAAAGGGAALIIHVYIPLVSELLVALVLGAVAANLGGTRAVLTAGLATASRRVLRIGVALLGFQVTAAQVLGLGWWVIGLVVLVVAGGILTTLFVGSILGVPPARRLLIACGFSVCGAAAVAAVEGVTDSKEEDVAAAIALVVAFGSVAMLVLPALSEQAGLGSREAGAWMGGAIHEVGQVVVAGGIAGGAAMQVAIVVKLARVLMLAPVLTVVSWQKGRAGAPVGGRRPPLVPAFVLVFVALFTVGSAVDVPITIRDGLAQVQGFALATAMFALGWGIDSRSMRRLRSSDLMLGLVSSACVALLALPLVLVV